MLCLKCFTNKGSQPRWEKKKKKIHKEVEHNSFPTRLLSLTEVKLHISSTEVDFRKEVSSGEYKVVVWGRGGQSMSTM